MNDIFLDKKATPVSRINRESIIYIIIIIIIQRWIKQFHCLYPNKIDYSWRLD